MTYLHSTKARTLALIILLLSAVPAHSSPSILEQGKTYIDAYQALDDVKLAALYSERARFIDTTSRGFPDGGFHAEGRSAVLDLIRSFKSRYRLESLEYVSNLTFATDREVVLAGLLRSSVRDNEGLRVYQTPVVTIVTIENGQVVEHRDYLHYAAGREVAR